LAELTVFYKDISKQASKQARIGDYLKNFYRKILAQVPVQSGIWVFILGKSK